MNSLRHLRASFLGALAAAALLTGCGTGILGGGSGPYDNSPSDRGPYDNSQYDDLQGTVTRVDTLDRRIVVDTDGYGNSLRNDSYGSGDEVVLYYDDSTRVEHQGRSYRPEDLERGDRIRASVDQTGNRLMVQDIEVIYDATAGSGSDQFAEELRGTVRYVDTRNRTLEIENTGRTNFSTGGTTDVVVVQWDDRTTVEFQGRRYQPENLERGDRVEIEVRDLGGRLIAEEILVVSDARTGR
jgi:hypothetical protein